ncbi:hypothetical protein [Pedobacter frigidisoli]|uniref:hypothetical protein n=1 Tax=Pedobacter frigidisoli TaxID=2530455 RepID=UPI00292ECFB7|nr:hypothetical protein [Pedobacter frigidisoli]
MDTPSVGLDTVYVLYCPIFGVYKKHKTMNNISGKVIIITGASSGIGLATAKFI